MPNKCSGLTRNQPELQSPRWWMNWAPVRTDPTGHHHRVADDDLQSRRRNREPPAATRRRHPLENVMEDHVGVWIGLLVIAAAILLIERQRHE